MYEETLADNAVGLSTVCETTGESAEFFRKIEARKETIKNVSNGIFQEVEISPTILRLINVVHRIAIMRIKHSSSTSFPARRRESESIDFPLNGFELPASIKSQCASQFKPSMGP
jgi:hypothetical protein